MNRIRVNIPEQETKNWYIRKVVGDSSTIYSDAVGRDMGGKTEPHDEYTFLCQKNPKSNIVMADTYHEYREHQHLWDNASGNVLIGGLGLGFVNHFLINAPNIQSVTIIEKEQEVIDMVWQHCPKDERFELVHADIESYAPTRTWDYGWFDTYIGGNLLTEEQYRQKIFEIFGANCFSINFWEPIWD